MRQWRANFQAEHGRAPSMEEFQDAKARGFAPKPVTELVQNDAPKTMAEWKELFVQTNGRVPSMEEFQAAKKAMETENVAEEQAERVEPVVIPVQSEPIQVQQATAQQTSTTPTQPVRAQAPKTPMTVTKKILLVLGAILLVVLGGAYAYGDHYFSKESVA